MRVAALVPVMLLVLLTGCGSSSSSSSASFSLAVAPSTVTLQNNGAAQALTVSVNPAGGFQSPVSVSLTGLPSGVSASPATLTVKPGDLGQFMLTASGAVVSSSEPVAITGSASTLTASATATVAVSEAVSKASLSVSSFDFGADLVGMTLTKSVVTVTNTGQAEITLQPTLAGDASYSLVPAQSCAATLAAGATCAETVTYTPTVASAGAAQTATLNLGLGNVADGSSETVNLTGTSAVLAPGTVTPTANPMVAQYTMALPFPGSVTVHFGADTSYGLETSAQSTTTSNGTVSLLVAGMPQNTTYHLQAQVQFANGLTAEDVDHTFDNGSSEVTAAVTTTTTAGMTPQPGAEMLSILAGPSGANGLVATDLQGNVIWSYGLPGAPTHSEIEAVKLLPNGDFLINVGEGSSWPITSAPQDTAIIAVREIDLAGNVVREITANDLTGELQAQGYNFTVEELHHEVTPLPNGHWLVLANILQPFTDLPGYPGTTNVLGDIVVDLDPSLNPVWVWNAFDHLDVNRHPYLFPDWTHSNTIVYTPDDHNILLSMRHQNWIVKLDYEDGKGSGDILWRLGEGGDFTLVNGVDPTDWFYAQHAPSLFSKSSAGVFSLAMVDNGDDREFPAGVNCGSMGAPPCLYTSIPVMQIDETAKTATLTFHQILDPSLYSNFGGSTELLADGNYEYDLAGTARSDIFEVTPESTPQTVWHLHLTSGNAYRGFRLPSLYPGVQW